MKKLIVVSIISILAALFCLASGIYCIANGNIVLGVLDILLSVFNFYLGLLNMSVAWDDSEKIKKKYLFTCKHCGEKHVPSFYAWFFVPHIFSTRLLRCPRCHKISYMRRK